MTLKTNIYIALVASEAVACEKNPDRMGALLERQARSLGMTIALAAGGIPQRIDEIMAGIEGYMYEEAVSKTKFAQFMNSMRGNNEHNG